MGHLQEGRKSALRPRDGAIKNTEMGTVLDLQGRGSQISEVGKRKL